MNLTTIDPLRVLLLVLALVCLGIVGHLDAEDAELEADHYCQMVRDGYWPNYQGIDCSRADLEKLK